MDKAGGGIGFVGALQIAFIVLKLCNVIKWSWIWVLSPLWISGAITIVYLLGFFIFIIIKVIKEIRNV